MTLADAGYQVITAANGRQALASLAETRPDVIVTDMMMPVLDGPGLLAALAADPAHRDIPVILSARSTRPRRRSWCRATGRSWASLSSGRNCSGSWNGSSATQPVDLSVGCVAVPGAR